MTRLWMIFLALFALEGVLAAQAMVEGALGAGAAATGTSATRGIGSSVGGIVRSLDNALKSAGDQAPATPAASAAKPRAILADPVRSYEDAAGIQTGMTSAEVLRRFGPPLLDMMGADIGRMLTYRTTSGVYQLEMKNDTVSRISVTSRSQTALTISSH